MFMSLIPHLIQPNKGKVLIIVSSVELALQTEAAAKRLLGEGWTIEVEQGRHVSSGIADV
jgi:ATP-dependent helicase IRC3